MIVYSANIQPQLVGNTRIEPGQLTYAPDCHEQSLRAIPGMMVGKDAIQTFFRTVIPHEEIEAADKFREYDVLQISSPLLNCGVREYTNYLIKNLRRSAAYVSCKDARNGLLAGLYPNKVLHYQYNAAYAQSGELACIAELQDHKTVCTLHDVPSCIPLLSKFDAIICHTEKDQSDVRAFTSFPEKIHHIPQGFPALFTGEPHGSQFKPLLGFIGFMSAHKGIHKLVEHLPSLVSEHPQIGCRVVSSINHDLAGQNAFQFAKMIHDGANRLGVGNRIEWVHDHLTDEEIQKYLAACDLIVLPYIFGSAGGSSAALRMALSSGVPVLCSDVGILMDVNEGIFRFAAGDVDNLPSHIRGALSSDLVAKREEAKGVVNKYSWANIAKQTDVLYETLLTSTERNA